MRHRIKKEKICENFYYENKCTSGILQIMSSTLIATVFFFDEVIKHGNTSIPKLQIASFPGKISTFMIVNNCSLT